MRGDGVKSEDKRPQPPATWQPNSDRLSAERKPDPTDVRENGSPTMRPERLVMADITATPKSKTRSPDKNLTSLYRVLRLHGNQLFQSTKRSLVIAKQSAQQKFAARAASRKAKKKARDLAQLRSVLLIDFWPSEEAKQGQLRDAGEVGRQAEEARRQAEAPARIKTEQERQQAQAEQARLQAEEETRRAEEAGRQAEAQVRIKADQERQQAQAEQARLQAEKESLKDSETKHCPKCKRVFSSDRDYCLYDAAWLVSATDASLRPAVKQDATTGTVGPRREFFFLGLTVTC